MWFKLKINQHWIQGPCHLLYQLQLWRDHTDVVQNPTHETIQRGAYYAHSEHLLQSLLCSSEEENRRFAVNKIIEIREQREKDAEEPKPKKK